MHHKTFFEKGWLKFDHDPALARWAKHALPAARQTVSNPANAEWHRCGGTWFVGVNVLANGPDGALASGPPLAGQVIDTITSVVSPEPFTWDRGQVSVCYPGYPGPPGCEPDTAYTYRKKRDAAHIDGLLPEGPDRRRHLRELHGFLLGIPATPASPGASPLVVWENSHAIVRRNFKQFFKNMAPQHWADADITATYHATRREIFATCRRIELPVTPGEALLVHRLTLHGIAPWHSAATPGPDGRMIIYFRPAIKSPRNWLFAP